VVRRDPDTVRGPDVSFVSSGRLDRVPVGFIPFAPDLAIEILSPEDHPSEMSERITDYLSGGAHAWVVDPARRSVTIHRPDRAPDVRRETSWVEDSEVLPGFRCAVEDVFADRQADDGGLHE